VKGRGWLAGVRRKGVQVEDGGEGGLVGSDHGTNQPVTPGGGLSFKLFCSCLSNIELQKTPDNLR